MTRAAHRLGPDSLPIAPTAEEWQAMSPRAREAFLDEANMALEAETMRLSEGSPHIESKFAAFQVLRDHFKRIGRQIYIKPGLAVHYPGASVFAPDLLLVQGVDDPGIADTRMAWVVADEGRGLDFVLEVLYAGNRQKDLFDNLATYAGHGISEYFVYDRLKQRLHGWRLQSATTSTYEPIRPLGGAFRSTVLGLELSVVEGSLCFFYGGTPIPTSVEIIERLNAIVDELSQRAESEAARVEEETVKALEGLDARLQEEALARRAAEVRAEEAERRIAELLARLGESG
jgi:Uma2 family endonuclease